MGQTRAGEVVLAAEAGVTLPQFWLAWVLREADVAAAIVGASRPSQIDENTAASEAQIAPELFARAEALFSGLAGSNPLKFMRTFADLGLKEKMTVLAGWTAMDDALLKSFGDEAVGAYSAHWYSAEHDTPSNKRFVADMQKDYGVIPGGYSAGMYIAGQVVEAALEKAGGKTDDKQAFMNTMRAVALTGAGVAPPGVSLTPFSITFPHTGVTLASPPQIITLTNNGGLPLTFSAPAIPKDFTLAGGEGVESTLTGIVRARGLISWIVTAASCRSTPTSNMRWWSSTGR